MNAKLWNDRSKSEDEGKYYTRWRMLWLAPFLTGSNRIPDTLSMWLDVTYTTSISSNFQCTCLKSMLSSSENKFGIPDIHHRLSNPILRTRFLPAKTVKLSNCQASRPIPYHVNTHFMHNAGIELYAIIIFTIHSQNSRMLLSETFTRLGWEKLG